VASNFSWLVPERIAGMGWPCAEDIPWLRAQGVTAIVSLTESPPPSPGDLAVCHVPVRDFAPPAVADLERAVRFARVAIGAGGRVAVHCAAGIGRTGTVLAAYLVAEGMSAEEAIAAVRRARPGSIETSEQERSVFLFAEHWRKEGA
jgi:atypical dual specificity phosphatase